MEGRDRRLLPVLSEAFETTVPGLFAIGESAGFVGPSAPESAEGARCGAIGYDPGDPKFPARVRAEEPNELEGYFRELLPILPKWSKTLACACEDVLLHELVEANERGYLGIEVTKRYTGLGTRPMPGPILPAGCPPPALPVGGTGRRARSATSPSDLRSSPPR